MSKTPEVSYEWKCDKCKSEETVLIIHRCDKHYCDRLCLECFINMVAKIFADMVMKI